VIVAAGDIACDKDNPSFNGGLGSGMSCRQKAVSDTILAINPAAVLTLGDVQYEDGEADQWAVSYGASWGRFKAKTHPSIGNHEYLYCGVFDLNCTYTVPPNDGTAKAYSDYFGAAAGALDRYYYSYNVGTWHLIALNSDSHGAGGLAVGSEQYNWLANDLATHPNACTLVYWHHPRFSSGQHGDNTSMAPIYQLLYDKNVDVVLAGHDHDYERTALLNPSGAIDTARGIRNWVVGTGGRNIRTGTVAPRSTTQAWNDNSFGVLKLTLHPKGYDFAFVPSVGTYTDSGSGACH